MNRIIRWQVRRAKRLLELFTTVTNLSPKENGPQMTQLHCRTASGSDRMLNSTYSRKNQMEPAAVKPTQPSRNSKLSRTRSLPLAVPHVSCVPGLICGKHRLLSGKQFAVNLAWWATGPQGSGIHKRYSNSCRRILAVLLFRYAENSIIPTSPHHRHIGCGASCRPG